MIWFRKKKKNKQLSREELLENNAGVPFDTVIPDTIGEDPIAYMYTDVLCDLLVDDPMLKPGAALYARKGGVIANVASENIARIQNRIISRMVDDFYNKDRFSIIRARLSYYTDTALFCNIGFYIDTIDCDDEDDYGED